jgi:hypothetical protein
MLHRRFLLLPIHWATLEDNDEVEGVEKEPFDITNGESDITLRRIGSFMHPRQTGTGWGI